MASTLRITRPYARGVQDLNVLLLTTRARSPSLQYPRLHRTDDFVWGMAVAQKRFGVDGRILKDVPQASWLDAALMFELVRATPEDPNDSKSGWKLGQRGVESTPASLNFAGRLGFWKIPHSALRNMIDAVPLPNRAVIDGPGSWMHGLLSALQDRQLMRPTDPEKMIDYILHRSIRHSTIIMGRPGITGLTVTRSEHMIGQQILQKDGVEASKKYQEALKTKEFDVDGTFR